MAAVQISDLAYEDFIKLLKENDIDSNTIRIYIAGMGWSGPAFNLVLDEQKDNDIVEKVKDMNFLVDKDLSNQYGCLTLKSARENGRGGFSIEPEFQTESDCGGGCSTCH